MPATSRSSSAPFGVAWMRHTSTEASRRSEDDSFGRPASAAVSSPDGTGAQRFDLGPQFIRARALPLHRVLLRPAQATLQPQPRRVRTPILAEQRGRRRQPKNDVNRNGAASRSNVDALAPAAAPPSTNAPNRSRGSLADSSSIAASIRLLLERDRQPGHRSPPRDGTLQRPNKAPLDHSTETVRQSPCAVARFSRVSAMASPAACAAECPVTADRKSARWSAYRLESTAALTVAVRGMSRRSAISPK